MPHPVNYSPPGDIHYVLWGWGKRVFIILQLSVICRFNVFWKILRKYFASSWKWVRENYFCERTITHRTASLLNGLTIRPFTDMKIKVKDLLIVHIISVNCCLNDNLLMGHTQVNDSRFVSKRCIITYCNSFYPETFIRQLPKISTAAKSSSLWLFFEMRCRNPGTSW